MVKKETVALKLREAATEIQSLTDKVANLESEKAELLQKIASLESTENHDEASALQKQADDSFIDRGVARFGSASDEGAIPVFGSDLTPEQRMDMILAGESPSDFS